MQARSLLLELLDLQCFCKALLDMLPTTVYSTWLEAQRLLADNAEVVEERQLGT